MMGKKKKISDFILLVLEKTVDGYVRFEDFTYHAYRYHYGIPDLKKSSLSQTLKRLRERGLIDFVSNEKLAYRLTDKGREKAVLASLTEDDKKWDGKWRLVIFDIPEKRRQVRNLLRTNLKKWGFVHWQKSVWASQADCTQALRNFIKSVGIEDWVIVLESDNVGKIGK